MQDAEQEDPSIRNMAICTPPKKMKNDAELLATFDVTMWPVRAKNLRLVRHQGTLRIWTTTRDLNFISSAKVIIIEAAMEKVRDALDHLDVLER